MRDTCVACDITIPTKLLLKLTKLQMLVIPTCIYFVR